MWTYMSAILFYSGFNLCSTVLTMQIEENIEVNDRNTIHQISKMSRVCFFSLALTVRSNTLNWWFINLNYSSDHFLYCHIFFATVQFRLATAKVCVTRQSQVCLEFNIVTIILIIKIFATEIDDTIERER